MSLGLPLSTIGFDADDTLWQNEHFYRLTERRFAELLTDYVDGQHLSDRLLEAEKRNLQIYGFGIKGFAYPEYFAVAFAARELGRPVHWIAARGLPYRDEKGVTVRMMGAVIDISERKRVEGDRERLLAGDDRFRAARPP